MAVGVECFLVQATGRGYVNLRRYYGGACTAGGYCQAQVTIADDVPIVYDGDAIANLDGTVDRDDIRWPSACAACGVPFTPDAAWQVNQHERWATPDGRVSARVSDLPPGATYRATWLDGTNYANPADGLAWIVTLPDGAGWPIYGPASNGGERWTVTGDAPRFTATPSIQTPRYHGWLTDGVLSPA